LTNRLFSSTPLTKAAIVPDYIQINRVPIDHAVELLLATSALPLGLTKWRVGFDGSRLVDGGVVDNLPWYPLIQDFPCDEIYIIGCGPIHYSYDSESQEK